MKRLITILISTVLLFCTVFSVTASAASFDANRRGDITLHYNDGEIPFEGLDIYAYRIASMQSNAAFKVLEPYSDYVSNINNIESQAEWDNLANTLMSYIIADNIEPYVIIGTDDEGTVVMDYMQTGLYHIPAVTVEKDGTVYSFKSFFVFLPSPDETGWNYDVQAIPKKEKYSGYLEYRVIKLWQDTENNSERPQSIEVDIFRDGEYNHTRTLDTENNWAYIWQDTDGKGVWTVAEKNVPENYTVTISRRENVFSIINKYEAPIPTVSPSPTVIPAPTVSPLPTVTPEPSVTPNPTENPDKPSYPQHKVPDTGDTTNAMLYIILMCVSGLGLIIIGIYNGRKTR